MCVCERLRERKREGERERKRGREGERREGERREEESLNLKPKPPLTLPLCTHKKSLIVDSEILSQQLGDPFV